MDEIWKQVPGDPLEVSSLGRVRTIGRPMIVKPGRGNKRAFVASIVLAPKPHSSGYLQIEFWSEGKRNRRYVHRLVAGAFVPGFFEGATVDHLDGDRRHNLPANLEWVSRSENSVRQNRAGRGLPKGERNPRSKISDETAARLPQMRAVGMSLGAIGREVGLSAASVAQRLGERRGYEYNRVHATPIRFSAVRIP